ncbi:hypothetical protein JQ617_10365 [Bradyrhizobium sp. KB893862 SZCCT0404]|uniref:hypothetical protein n=1 Tax=Bradyrhizobium sp. KB893862 SZCCT0404 TaxID=2807672 RepID=UPI001BAAEBFC|nr:hypothetical protein [Bradyrhizobium sp. KB893862 SZCCT0404]MBR1174356.1 hypothetical protein [Bradyrhizobium sp. KB893862 SZCCT0404]
MKDMQEHLEKLRVQIVECEMIRDLATDPKKRDLFARLAEHHKVLAAEVERAISTQSPPSAADETRLKQS